MKSRFYLKLFKNLTLLWLFWFFFFQLPCRFRLEIVNLPSSSLVHDNNDEQHSKVEALLLLLLLYFVPQPSIIRVSTRSRSRSGTDASSCGALSGLQLCSRAKKKKKNCRSWQPDGFYYKVT